MRGVTHDIDFVGKIRVYRLIDITGKAYKIILIDKRLYLYNVQVIITIHQALLKPIKLLQPLVLVQMLLWFFGYLL